ncbi:MAG: hypothetical protein PUI32_03840 [Bacteroidales bacterium]|nr:hypothetical protein [Bacteroidales bacterium]MDY5208519.1 hypothetical protein [Sodaliphilus sp.]
MKQVEERYISLLTDFGFKRIFGTAMNKNLLICFLMHICYAIFAGISLRLCYISLRSFRITFAAYLPTHI